jgi:hypothetical protein
MNMRVGEARHQKQAASIDGDVGRFAERHTQLRNPSVPNHHVEPRPGRRASAVDYRNIADEE